MLEPLKRNVDIESFGGRHHDRYGIPVSLMTTDMLHLLYLKIPFEMLFPEIQFVQKITMIEFDFRKLVNCGLRLTSWRH
jgi:hypothetical protein